MAERDTKEPSGAGGVYEERTRGGATEAAKRWVYAKQQHQELCPRVLVSGRC